MSCSAILLQRLRTRIDARLITSSDRDPTDVSKVPPSVVSYRRFSRELKERLLKWGEGESGDLEKRVFIIPSDRILQFELKLFA